MTEEENEPTREIKPEREAEGLLDQLGRVSDAAGPAPSGAVPAYPFQLHIQGKLTEAQTARLLSLLENEKFGITRLDLEHQLDVGKILLPQISEYAGVLVAQALRDADVELRLVPADEPLPTALPTTPKIFQATPPPIAGHPAESLPITNGHTLPGLGKLVPLDTITASATLQSTALEPAKSADFDELVESLKRELKYRAYRKGAQGITHVQVNLHELDQPTEFKLLVTGTAVRSSPE